MDDSLDIAKSTLEEQTLREMELLTATRDFTFAAKLKGGDVLSTQFFLPPTPNVTYSACLVAQIEEMILTGRAPYPVERTQISSAMLERCLDSKMAGHRRIETPDLDISYQAPRESRFGG